MVNKILNLLHQEIRSLHEAAYLLGLFALFSAILALVRDRLLAHFFGAGELLDVYYASFRIPDLVFVSIASMVSIYVLIPFLTEKKDNGLTELEQQKRFIGGIFSVFTSFVAVVSVVLFILTPYLLPFIFKGLVGSVYFDDLIVLTRLLLLQPILLGVSNIFASVTQVYGRFILYAVSPLLYNLGIILGVIFLYPSFGIIGLGYGVVFGALLHVGIQLPFIVKEGFLSKVGFTLRLSEIKNVVFLSLPRTLALSSNHLAVLALIGIASVLTEGSITIFSFSFNLQAVPLTIIGASYSVAAFPTLARLFSNGDKKDFVLHMSTAIKHIIFWSMPVIVLLVVLRAQVVRVILGSGAFDWADTRLVAAGLALFSVSLLAQSLTLLFVRGHYAQGNTRIPLIINVATAGLLVVFAYTFTKLFQTTPYIQVTVESLLRVEGISGTEVLMLPLAFSLSAIVNACLFWILFVRHSRNTPLGISRMFFQVLTASLVMGVASYKFLLVLSRIFDLNTFWGIFAQGFCAGVIGILSGVIVLKLLGNREIDEIWGSLHHKFWKSKTVGLEEADL